MWWFEKCLSINHYKSLSKAEAIPVPSSCGATELRLSEMTILLFV